MAEILEPQVEEKDIVGAASEDLEGSDDITLSAEVQAALEQLAAAALEQINSQREAARAQLDELFAEVELALEAEAEEALELEAVQ